MVFYLVYKIRCLRFGEGRSAASIHPLVTTGWNQPFHMHSLQEEAEGTDGACYLKKKSELINYTSWYINKKVRPAVSGQIRGPNLCSHSLGCNSLVNTQLRCTFLAMSLTNSNSHGSRTQSHVRGIPASKDGRMKEVVVIGAPLYGEQQMWEGRSRHTGLGKLSQPSNMRVIHNDRDTRHWSWRACNDKTWLAGLISIPYRRRVIKCIAFPLHSSDPPAHALPVSMASIAPATSKTASGLDIAQCRRELVS